MKLRSALIRYLLVASASAVVALSVAGAAAGSVVTGGFTWRPYLDPQIAWSNYSLNVVYDTYVPLLTYRHANGKAGSDVIPGLARSLPRITDHGRTYTLRLRKGLRYSDGEPVRAADFKFAVERLFRANALSGYYGPERFYDDIVGAARFERTLRGGIPGVVTDNRTGKIVVHLVRPESSFVRKLAMTFVAPVPPGTPMSSRTSDPPPATGPYVITRSTRLGWTYERNPEWRSHNHQVMPRIPSGHLDTIRIRVVRSVATAIRQVEEGKLDWISREMPGRAYASLRHRFPDRVRAEPTLSTEYFWLNTSRSPFDDVRVRRAVNYAVDDAVFRRISRGQFLSTQQVLPPDIPGFRKFAPYPHDIAKARRLIAAVNPSDRAITLWTYGGSGYRIGRECAAYFAAVLDQLGFSVQLKVLGVERYFDHIENSGKDDLDAGIGGYFANFPGPDDFFEGTLGARVTPYFNGNFAQLLVPGLKRLLDRLETSPRPRTPEAGYAALDRAYTRLAPWVPIGNIAIPLFVSRRIDLGAVVSNPSFGVDLTSLRRVARGG